MNKILLVEDDLSLIDGLSYSFLSQLYFWLSYGAPNMILLLLSLLLAASVFIGCCLYFHRQQK